MDRYTCMAPGRHDREHLIFDRKVGIGRDGLAIASIKDAEMAYRITRLLNADQAMLEKQGVRG